jgi:hypothetical protein
MEDNKSAQDAILNTALKAKTPINIFAIAMMACASILGGSATLVDSCESLTAFKYSIHAFIAISGMFFLALLFCRKGIYHPQDLEKLSPEVRRDLGKDRPALAAVLIIIILAVYGAYQYKVENPCEATRAQSQVSQHSIAPDSKEPETAEN